MDQFDYVVSKLLSCVSLVPTEGKCVDTGFPEKRNVDKNEELLEHWLAVYYNHTDNHCEGSGAGSVEEVDRVGDSCGFCLLSVL